MHLNDVDVAFLSEPKVFSHDVNKFVQHFTHNFSFFLNSEDKHDLELPLSRSQAFGGTMAIWKSSLDPFISVHPVSTSSFLPIIFSPPNTQTSIHIGLYLPTSGLETEFIEAITMLRVAVDDLNDLHPDAPIFLRGDCNVNKNNAARTKVFEDFTSNLHFKNIPTNHNTYHHFIGNGLFDSNIDIIMHSSNFLESEKIVDILCQANYPEVDSHHDIILSSVTLPFLASAPTEGLILAPRIPSSLHRITWTDCNLPAYEAEVSDALARIRQNWQEPGSPVSVSILLELTYKVLSNAALKTNRSVHPNQKNKRKHLKVPKDILIAQQTLRKTHTALKTALNMSSEVLVNNAKEEFKKARKFLRLVTRRNTHREDIRRDSHLHAILTNNPKSLFQAIKSAKKPRGQAVPFVTVGNKKYIAEQVPDGLYDSISSLKKENTSRLHSLTCI